MLLVSEKMTCCRGEGLASSWDMMSEPSRQGNVSLQGGGQNEAGLGELLGIWWRSRVRIILHGLAAVSVAVAVLGAVFVFRPTQQQSTVVFRLLFKGVEKNQYPNGMQFTPGDIVATPVLAEVYKRNSLEKFGEFDDFKSAFAVINRNPALERLRREYAPRLEDRRLTPVDRQKLEAEYDSRMKAIQNGEFTLVLQQEGALASWPETLAGKVMEDVLSVWAEQSRSRGVFKFDLSIYSENLLAEITNSTSDYTLLLDRLRLAVNRILGNLEALAETPGARLVRVGEKQTSLGEIEANLRDNLTFDLREINSIIFSFGLFREPVLTEAYLKEQLFRLDVERKELQSRNEGMQRAVADYAANRSGVGQGSGATSAGGGNASLMPQLSDGFLDRILDLSGQNTDIAFRQDISRQIIQNERAMYQLETERQLYQRSLDALQKGGMQGGVNGRQIVDERINQLVTRLRATLQNVSLLHAELSNRNLQPSLVYALVQPLQQERVSKVRMLAVGIVLVLGITAYLGLVLVSLARRQL